MAFIHGKDSDVMLGAASIAEMATWNVTITREVAEGGAFQDEWKKVKQGIAGWTASVDGMLDLTDAEQTTISNVILSGGELTDIRFYEDATNYWTVDTGSDPNAFCIINDYNITADKSDIVKVSFSVTGSGPIHRTS